MRAQNSNRPTLISAGGINMNDQKLDPKEIKRLNQQLANDSFANEGRSNQQAKVAKNIPELTDTNRVIFSGEINRDSVLDDG